MPTTRTISLRIARVDSPPPAEDRPEDCYPAVREAAEWYAKGRRTTAEDMAHDGMVAVLSRWAEFDPALSSRRTWAGKVALWGMRDSLRRSGSHAVIRLPRSAVKRGIDYPRYERLRQRVGGDRDRPVVDLADPRELDPLPADPGEFLIVARTLAGRALTRREREAVLLYFVRGMSMRESGSHMGLSESRVSQVLSGFVAECRAEAGVPA